jgi:hypothetical protein
MKRIIALIFFLLFMFGYSFAQPTFSNRYLQGLEICNLLDLAPDNGYYFCGRSTDLDIILGKTDSAGNLQWAKKIGYPFLRESPYDMVALNNGNVIVAWVSDSGVISSTARTFIISFDMNGNHIFTKKFINSTTGTTNIVNNMIKDGNGFSISITNDTPSEARFLKCDSLGNKIKSIKFQYSYSMLFKTSAGYYFAYNLFGNIISKFSSSFAYQGTGHNSANTNINYGIIEVSNNSFILYGGFTYSDLCNFNSNMQFQWSKSYTFPNFQPMGKFAISHKIDANSILFYGENESCGTSVPCHPFLLKIDTLGMVKNCQYLTTGGSNTDDLPTRSVFRNGIFTFIQNEKMGVFQPSGSFKINCTDTTLSQLCDVIDTTAVAHTNGVTSGMYTYTSGQTNDSLANDSIPCFNILLSYGDCNDSTLFANQLINKKIDFSISPNPTTSFISIHYNRTSNTKTTVTLYNLYGQIVYSENFQGFKNSEGLNETKIDMRSFAAGIYFVKMNVGGKEEVRKVVKY